MSFLTFILNFPWTLAGFISALFSIPTKFAISRQPFAVVVSVKSFWWIQYKKGYKGVRASAIGQIILLGPKADEKDKKHELVHVEQHIRRPLIQPFLYAWENHKRGYRKNKYEVEAYTKSGNHYKE